MFKKSPPPLWEKWHIKLVATPNLDTNNQLIGEVKFGDDLSKAIIFGKPNLTQSLEGEALNLIYCNAGFQIEFDNMKLSSAAYFIDDDTLPPRSQELKHSSPKIDGNQFSNNTTLADLEKILGKPQSVDKDEEESIIVYLLSQLTIEFELGKLDTLKRINIYPTDKMANRVGVGF